MFPRSFFCNNMFAPSFFPKVGLNPPPFTGIASGSRMLLLGIGR